MEGLDSLNNLNFHRTSLILTKLPPLKSEVVIRNIWGQLSIDKNAELESTLVKAPNHLPLVSGLEPCSGPSPGSCKQLCDQLFELATYQGGVRSTNHNVALKPWGLGC